MKTSLAIVLVLLTVGCKREERAFRVQPPAATAVQAVVLSQLHPGSTQPSSHVTNPYEKNAYALSEGQRLFNQMNCSGCHFHGGGGIGPPLMDDKWIYGGEPEQIFRTIVEGRPNGMPSFRNKLNDNDVWKIVAYVRSMSGNASQQAAPGRTDDMSTGKPENSRSPSPPNQSTLPPSAVFPG